MMKQTNKRWVLLPAVLLAFFMFTLFSVKGQSQNQKPGPGLTGFVKDHQDQPVQGAIVSIVDPSASNQQGSTDQAVGSISTETQADGRFLLNIPEPISSGQVLNVTRALLKVQK